MKRGTRQSAHDADNLVIDDITRRSRQRDARHSPPPHLIKAPQTNQEEEEDDDDDGAGASTIGGGGCGCGRGRASSLFSALSPLESIESDSRITIDVFRCHLPSASSHPPLSVFRSVFLYLCFSLCSKEICMSYYTSNECTDIGSNVRENSRCFHFDFD